MQSLNDMTNTQDFKNKLPNFGDMIKMPTYAAKQLTAVNKFSIVDTLPIVNVDSGEQFIKQEDNARRVLFNMPWAFDFICNMLKIWNYGNGESLGIRRIDDITKDNTAAYGFEIDYNLLGYYFETPEMYLHFYLNMDYNRKLKPCLGLWRKFDNKFYTQNTQAIDVFAWGNENLPMTVYIAKCVFSGMIEKSGYKKGYIQLPIKFMPKIIEYNPDLSNEKTNIIYKTNIFGLLNNFEKKEKIEVKRGDFCKEILSNYTRPKNGVGYYLEPAYYDLFKNTINPQVNKIAELYNNEFLLVKNVILGKSEDKRTGRQEQPTEIFFTDGKEKHINKNHIKTITGNKPKVLTEEEQATIYSL